MAVKKNEAKVTEPKERTVKEDLEHQKKAMQKDSEAKLAASADHFLATCETVSEKYRTVNGAMQVKDAVAQACLNTTQLDDDWFSRKRINGICDQLSTLAMVVHNAFYEKIRDNEIIDLEEVMDEWFDREFIYRDIYDAYDCAFQLCLCSMMQGFDGLLEDMVEFKRHTEEEIKKIDEQLEAL